MRLTCGTFQNGTKFAHVDNWRKHEQAHTKLKLPWTGSTVFFENECLDISACVASICAVHDAVNDVHMTFSKTVRFDEQANTHHSVQPYSEQFHCHPHFILASDKGWKKTPARADVFTGKSAVGMKARRLQARRRLKGKMQRQLE